MGRLAAAGVGRFVLSHGGASPDLEALARLGRAQPAELVVAGGVHDLDALLALRQAGVGAVILGETLLSGAVDYVAASAALA